MLEDKDQAHLREVAVSLFLLLTFGQEVVLHTLVLIKELFDFLLVVITNVSLGL